LVLCWEYYKVSSDVGVKRQSMDTQGTCRGIAKNINWFMFRYIYLKVDLTINLRQKLIVEFKRYKF